MPLRLFSDQVLEFTLEGRPYMRGAPPGWQNMPRGERKEVTKEAYISLVKLASKMAMCEQGWEVGPDDPLYVVITINVRPIKQVFRNRSKSKWMSVTDQDKIKNEMDVHEPVLDRLGGLLMRAMFGTVYKTRRQIVGYSIVKRFAPKEGIGILVGVARDWRTLNNDLRNA